MFSTPNLVSGAVAGLWAGTAAILLSLLFRATVQLPTVPELVEDRLLGLLPGAVFSFLIDSLRFSAKPLFFGGLLLLQIVLGGAIGCLLAPIAWRQRRHWPAVVLVMALGLWGLTYRALVPLETAAGQANPLAASLLPVFGLFCQWLAFAAVYGLVHRRLTRGLAAADEWQRAAPTSRQPGEQPPPRPIVHPRGLGVSRRTAAGALAAGLAAVGAGSGLRAILTASSATPPAAGPPLAPAAGVAAAEKSGATLGVEGLSPEITPTGEFYTVSKNFFDPVVPKATWRVEIGGLVERKLTFDELAIRALPAQSQYATLACISNEVGGDLIGNAHWKGVPLGLLLTEAKVSAGAVDVVFHCHDGYADSIPIAKALGPATLCAYEMNGEPLNDQHGAPLRLIIPDIYGMKNAKWVTKIEVVDTDFRGYWQAQGWDDAAPYQIFTRIDSPTARNRRLTRGKPVTLAGVAFAGNRGLLGVEVSVDNGRSWLPATVRPPLGPLTWALWTLSWVPEQAGSFTVLARSTDGTGKLQESQVAGPFPNGATGYHSITVQVADV